MDIVADPLGSLVAVVFGLLGGLAWALALYRVFKGGGIGIQERWGGFGHGLGGWQVTPSFALVLIGASAIGISIAVMRELPERNPVRDADGDGVVDRADQCPAALEDFDGHWDADGCPDPDNDEDGRLDDADQCPADAEDVDGFEDEDGCPDPDNDGDAVLDIDDACPVAAEDIDRFEDEDGCPDPDNDGDGVCDPGIDPVTMNAACMPWGGPARIGPGRLEPAEKTPPADTSDATPAG